MFNISKRILQIPFKLSEIRKVNVCTDGPTCTVAIQYISYRAKSALFKNDWLLFYNGSL